MDNKVYDWSSIKCVYFVVYESEKYIIGYKTDDSEMLDIWSCFCNNIKIDNVDYQLVKYKSCYWLMPFYKQEPLINTDACFIKIDLNETNTYYVNTIISYINYYYPNPQEYDPKDYMYLYNRLGTTGVIKIDKPNVENNTINNNTVVNSNAGITTNKSSTHDVIDAVSFDDKSNNSDIGVLNPWDTLENSNILSLDDIKRPFDGEPFKPGVSTSEDHIEIPRDTKPRFLMAMNVLNIVNRSVGLPLSKKRVEKINTELVALCDMYDEKLRESFNVRYIDYTGRTAHDNNIAVLFCRKLDKYINYSDHIKNGKASLTLEHLKLINNRLDKRYNDILANMDDNTNYEAELQDCEEAITITKNLINYKSESAKLSQIKDFREIVRDIYPTEESEGIWVTKDANDDDIYWVHPKVRLAETNRFQCYSPNPQGKNPLVKSCITAPKGYCIMSLDISAQDVYVLVWGIMKDKTMKKNVIEMGDPYKALLTYCGYEPSDENKKILKRPLLSRMNGKMVRTILQENENHDTDDMITKLLNRIETEDGYKEIVSKAASESCSDVPMRSGLFGTRKVIPDVKSSKNSNKVSRQILNANFQMTSAEILCISYLTMMHDLTNNKINGITTEDFIPLLSIHDEIVALCKEDKADLCKDILRYYILPSVEGWGRMSGEITVGHHYEHK